MKRRHLRWFATGAVLAMLLVACGNGADDPATDEEPTDEEPADEGGELSVPDNPDEGVLSDTIRVGWMGDATGPTASAQGLNLRGIEAWVEYINEQGGVLDREVELIVRDDEFNAERAISNFRALVDDDRVLAIINVGGAHISEALMPDIEQVGIPIIGPPQTIDVQLDNPYVFNNIAHYGDQADIAVPRLAERAEVDVTDLRVAVVQLELPSGDEWDAYIRQTVEEQGGTYVDRLTMPTASPDFASIVTQLSAMVDAEGVNAIAFHGAPAHGLGVLNEMESQDFTDIPVVGIHGIAGSNIYTESPPGVQHIMQGVQSFTPCNVENEGTAIINEFVAGTPWEEDCRQINFSHGWLDGMIFQQAAERAAEQAGELSRETLTEALRGQFDTMGLSCPIDWTDSQHSPCGAPFVWDEDEEALVPGGGGFEPWAEFFDFEYGLAG